MTEFIKTWIYSITAVGVISTIALALTPEGASKRIVRLVCGLVLIYAVLVPLKDTNFSGIEALPGQYSIDLDRLQKKAETNNQDLTKKLIESGISAYIADKAVKLGVSCSIKVISRKSVDGLWSPWSVELMYDKPPTIQQKQSMIRLINEDCTIPPERQKHGYAKKG